MPIPFLEKESVMEPNALLHPAKVMEWQGFALVVGGAMFHALYQVLNKKMITNQAPADVIGTSNFFGAGLLLLISSLLFNPPVIWSWLDPKTGLLLPLGVTCLLNIVIMFGAIRANKYADVSLTSPISGFQPLFGLLPSWLVLGELPTSWGYVGLFSVVAGLYLFSFTEDKVKETADIPLWLKHDNGTLRYMAPLYMLFKNKGVKIAFVVMLCGSVSINFDKKAAILSSYLFAPALIFLFLAVVGLVKVWRTGEWKKVNKSHTKHLVLSALVLFVALACYWLAFQYGLAIYIGALKRTTPIFVMLLAWFILGEKKVARRWPGALIIAGGSVLLNF